MKDALYCDGRVLVVGDGDFSFTVSLMKHSDLRPDQVYTSNLETETSILHHAQANQNMTRLKDLGVSVFLETDARDLHNHGVISKERFDRIVFNFPLADRHNIKKNRSLLADFFLSCKSVLNVNGQILVTLCKGQGGTPADQPIRSWHDSWQIVAMATNAAFFLHEVLPFDPSEFPEYHSVGFRFQDKSFNVMGALTHVFEEGQLVEDMDGNVCEKLVYDGKSYSCSGYVASTLRCNLLEETRNPLCILRQNLEEKLKTDKAMSNLVIENGFSPIIPSHKSSVFLNIREETVDTMKSDKDWKNCENLKIMNKVNLAHGVAGKGDDKDRTGDCSVDDVMYSPSLLLPTTSENVYVLVKTKDKIPEELFCDGQLSEELSAKMAEGESSSRACVGTSDCCDSEGNRLSCSEESSSASEDSSSLVYHCRTSLLEDLPRLCQVLNNHHHNLIEERHATDSKSLKNTDETSTLSSSAASTLCPSPSTVSSYSCNEQNTGNVSSDCFPCLVASGQCMLPCPITTVTLPTKHEMLILHQIPPSNLDQISQEHPTNPNHQYFDVISSKISSLLQSITSHCRKPDLSPLPNDSVYKINITGIDESQLDARLVPQSNGDSINQSALDSVSMGFFLSCRVGECFYHATILNLDRLVCYLCGIDNPRLLHSENEKFLCQIQGDLSLCQYRPFNLYPMKFVHDLSFWERDVDQGPFDVFSLYQTIRNVAGDVVVSVSLVDVYEEPDSRRKSRCYRLYFQSFDKCLSYVMSWKLQSKIRMEVARSLGVQLR